MLRKIAMFAALLFVSTLAHGKDLAHDKDTALKSQIDQLLRGAYPEDGPGAAAIVIDHGKTLLRSSYGLADLEHGIAIEPDMVFRLGSVTKQFTAAGIMMLAEEGRLSVDDDITLHLPDYPAPETKVTIEHLLTHTSGIPSYTDIPELIAKLYKPYTTGEILALFKDKELEFEPGSKWDYNNSGYFLLGAIIENVTGQSYANFIHQRIFEPLGMHQSHYGNHDQIIARRARGYHRDGDVYINAPYINMNIPHAGGSLLSTIDDLALWNVALGSDRLLPHGVLERMWTEYRLSNGEGSGYGYGWFVGEHKGSPVIHHAGDIHGFVSMGIHLPNRDAYIAVLSNNPHAQALAILAGKVADLVMGDPSPVAIEVTPKVLERYVGVYQTSETEYHIVTLKDGQLYTQRRADGRKRSLQFSSETEFLDNSTLTRGRFEIGDGGEVRGMMLTPWAEPGEFFARTHGPVPEGPKIAAVDPAIYDDYEGKYDFMSRFTITVRRDGDRLMAQAIGQPEFQLSPISETEFFGQEVGGRITFVRDQASGKVTSFVVRQGDREMTAKRVESAAGADTAAPKQGIEKSNLVLEGIPEIPPEAARRFQQYQNTRSAFFRGWHPSGEGILISTRFGETNQVHWVKSPGGARHQITFFDEPVSGMGVSPDPGVNGFVFGKDVGGSELYQLFFFDMKTGSHRMLTDGESHTGSISVSNRGDRVAFYTTQRNGRDRDIQIVDLNGKTPPRAVLERGGNWLPGGWSPDDRRLIVVRRVSANEAHPYILDLESDELTAIMSTEEKVAYGATTWSHDGGKVYFSSDAGSEFLQLRAYDVKTRDTRVLSADIPWNVDDVNVSTDGRWLAFTVNAGGIGEVHLWMAKGDSWEEATLPELPVGQASGLQFSPDSKHLALVLSTAQAPADTYMIELETVRLERWTTSEVGGLDTSGFSLPELIHFETFDEVGGKPRRIPSFYYKPKGHGEGPWPVLVNIHGGPEMQARPGFSSQIQYLLEELGIAILAPNVRGSAGYGKSYLKLDNGMRREGAVQDIGKLLDWIETRPELDSKRVAVMGASYGGYMALAAMTHFNDRLRGAIDMVGISNFVTFLENTREYRRDFRRVEYGDERDPEMREFLQRISPTTNAHKITKPLFIAQGENDPRVPASEAQQILEAVRENGGDPWYFLAKDEGHGLSKKSTSDTFSNALFLFLEKILFD